MEERVSKSDAPKEYSLVRFVVEWDEGAPTMIGKTAMETDSVPKDEGLSLRIGITGFLHVTYTCVEAVVHRDQKSFNEASARVIRVFRSRLDDATRGIGVLATELGKEVGNGLYLK